jgi:hypothetical protein
LKLVTAVRAAMQHAAAGLCERRGFNLRLQKFCSLAITRRSDITIEVLMR